MLIIPAPFKRCYIWDMAPEVSVVRRCLERGFRVFLLEWLDPRPGEDLGLDDFADSLPLAAVQEAASAMDGGPITLAGHSLGGTLAAIFATLHPEQILELWLIDAPLVFGSETGDRLAQILRSLDPDWLAAVGDPVAGSFISAVTAAALPDEFLWRPCLDFLASSWDPRLRRLHAQVHRWTLDEFPLPKRLFLSLANQLYREDRFREGSLRIGHRTAALSELRTPVVAILNAASAVVPPASISEGLRVARHAPTSTVTYEGDAACGIQHLGPLVAPWAHACIWPHVLQQARRERDRT
ncbi:alpha/beta fold hydrolase [Phenylobacterium sp. LjRoot219]|uniref:alpha/beta fold hydrolase n=1 Tax=Phenylobacterium sp. LjRoot219 TaxID=3342283 RepID=UPI003ED06443